MTDHLRPLQRFLFTGRNWATTYRVHNLNTESQTGLKKTQILPTTLALLLEAPRQNPSEKEIKGKIFLILPTKPQSQGWGYSSGGRLFASHAHRPWVQSPAPTEKKKRTSKSVSRISQQLPCFLLCFGGDSVPHY